MNPTCFIPVLTVITFLCVKLQTTSAQEAPNDDEATFLYFAYGSNMLTKRIHINNPTAVQKYIGFIENHRLDFNGFSKRWQGAVATIVPHTSSDLKVWGVVWKINMKDLPHLDDQEGVKFNSYFAKSVTVNIPGGNRVEARVYEQCRLPDKYVRPDLLPPERQPSLVYLSTMTEGAKEFGIPENYVRYLESFKNNGYNGSMMVNVEKYGSKLTKVQS
ncbi:hypothetical protein QAD02_022110 [Eretmocerus hayati]|uniref:Uncharacterized protein n=1 Tax=Eretmocerus hayati TaxID=131215 RepID=A0ACC2PS18_9HYME|nr:hypothetical protein QAD02_022110 [Eretmocerus hayati]